MRDNGPMKYSLYQVDAFASRVFAGNPAAVCPLPAWLPDAVLQAIAEENNLSETAFFVPAGDSYELRWFTPLSEVDLCGHATLASAHVLYRHLGHERETIDFMTRSGTLQVSRAGDDFCLDLPASRPQPVATPPMLTEGLGRLPQRSLAAMDHVAIYESEAEIRALTPDFHRLRQLGLRGVLASAPGDKADFVSRCFFPRLGVDEDPVTGSAHCQLAPYWSERLGRSQLQAEQLSRRGGSLSCRVAGDRVLLTGRTAEYMVAEIKLPDAAAPA